VSSPAILASVGRFLAGHAPFAQMPASDVAFAASRLSLVYFADGETVLEPGQGVPDHCLIVRQGGVRGAAAGPSGGGEAGGTPVNELGPGEVFPVGALLAERPVSAVYRAVGDLFCWRLPRRDFEELCRRSPVFLDFCRRRLAALLDLSRQALQARHAGDASYWRELSAPIGTMIRRPAVVAHSGESIRTVFERMEREGVGSVVVCEGRADGTGPLLGVFTRKDVIRRVSLPGLPLERPVDEVMSRPVSSLPSDASIADAMLVLAQRGIRHIPVLEGQRLLGVVTEGDLFALQRRNMGSIGERIDRAADGAGLAAAAAEIRLWSQTMVAQGHGADFVTRLITRLNDRLAARALQLASASLGVPLTHVCWLCFGSEGREEQTIASDQDNGIAFRDDDVGDRARFLALASEVNDLLALCGYGRCAGGVMASNPRWCLSESEWRDRFAGWIDRGEPESLLAASMIFDLRPITGDLALGARLRDDVTRRACGAARFARLMASSARRFLPPPSWTAGPIGQLLGADAPAIDLKLQGTMVFSEGIRVLALVHGVPVTGTVARIQALRDRQVLAPGDAAAWGDAFRFLQSLRLRIQHGQMEHAQPPNAIDLRGLSGLDSRILKEAFRQARKLHQRLVLDFGG
jgi:CBS domain-containing protein